MIQGKWRIMWYYFLSNYNFSLCGRLWSILLDTKEDCLYMFRTESMLGVVDHIDHCTQGNQDACRILSWSVVSFEVFLGFSWSSSTVSSSSGSSSFCELHKKIPTVRQMVQWFYLLFCTVFFVYHIRIDHCNFQQPKEHLSPPFYWFVKETVITDQLV